MQFLVEIYFTQGLDQEKYGNENPQNIRNVDANTSSLV